MKKKRNTQNPSAPSVLDSPNWLSESSIQEFAAAAPNHPPNGSDSPDPCVNCHVDFKNPEVAVKWAKDPENKYKAASNLKTDSGGWKPDKWSISSQSASATINEKTGVVTFGGFGETITVKAEVKRCPDCSSTFTLNIIEVRIYDGENDVTGKNTKRQVGELIDLDAVVIPSAFQPEDGSYDWQITGKVLKEYNDTAASDPVVPLTAVDGQTIQFFWLKDGDWKATVKLKTNNLEVALTARYNITRPTGKISVTKAKIHDPFFICDPYNTGNKKAWIMTGTIEFRRTNFAGGTGSTCWVQIITQKLTVDGQVIADQTGLDQAFPYPVGDALKADDAPGMGENVTNRDTVDIMSYTGHMYLMFLSDREGSSWVPLRQYGWIMNGTATRVGPPNHAPANYTVTGKTVPDPNDQNAADPPSWVRIVKNTN